MYAQADFQSYTEKQDSYSNSEKNNNKIGRIILLNFKNYSVAIVIKMWSWTRDKAEQITQKQSHTVWLHDF